MEPLMSLRVGLGHEVKASFYTVSELDFINILLEPIKEKLSKGKCSEEYIPFLFIILQVF